MTVVGDSMAPTIHGEHLQSTCQQCNRTFRHSFSQVPKSGRLVCPWCGLDRVDANLAETVAGDQVVIDSVETNNLKRGALVAFNNRATGEPSVKRILGLPSEAIRFQNGNLYVDEQLVRRAGSQTSNPWPLIRVWNFGPDESFGIRQRFKVENSNSSWEIGDRITGSRPSDRGSLDAEQTDWIAYRHTRCYRLGHAQQPTGPLDDFYGHNQNLARTPRELSEFQVRLKLQIDPDSQWVFAVHDGNQQHLIEFATPQSGRLEWNYGNQSDRISLDSTNPAAIDFTIGTLDDQLTLQLNHKVILNLQFDYRAPTSVTDEFFKIGLVRGAVTLQSFDLYRDMYFYSEGKQQWKLGQDEYFVLGDNLPDSSDSRQWPQSSVTTGDIIGQVSGKNGHETR